MAYLLGTQNVRALAGSRKLLEGITTDLDDGSRAGILGPSDAGKSTLLRIATGTQEPDGGVVARRDGVCTAVLSRADTLNPEDTVIQAVHSGMEEYEWASDPAVRDTHAGLIVNISPAVLVGMLSSGQHRRVVLVRVSAVSVDIVRLGEPINHPDVKGVTWLVTHLNTRSARPGMPGALLTVIHDRWLLDAVCEHIQEVVPGANPGGDRLQVAGRTETYDNSYVAYTLARTERLYQADVAAAEHASLLTKELVRLRRGAPVRTSKPRFHITTTEALITDVSPPCDTVELVEMVTTHLGKDVVDLEGVSVSFTRPSGSHLDILEGVTWHLAPTERVGIVGINGAGKTTILSLLCGDLEPISGRTKRGKTVQIVTPSQDTHELDTLVDMRVVKAVAGATQTVVVDGKEVSVSQMTEHMGFTRARAYMRISEVSGGERRHLQPMHLLMSQPNVLLLDELTNDLDTDTLASAEDLLNTFPGTLVVVSHDRYPLECVTDHQVALLGDGQVRALPGGVEQYLQMWASGDLRTFGSSSCADEAGSASRPVVPSADVSSDEGSAGQEGVRGGVNDAATRRVAKKKVAHTERKLECLRAEASSLETKMGKLLIQVAADPAAVSELTKVSAAHQDTLSEMDKLGEVWLKAADSLKRNIL